MKLIAKTHRGKNKLREAGSDEWKIVRTSDKVACLGERPGALIEPVCPPEMGASHAFDKRRWIEFDNDPDFDVIS
jgi:hypothetical protein